MIIARERARRPDEFQRPAPPAKAAEGACVFCPGNEDRTPPELLRLPYRGDAWGVLVVSNKFPALSPVASSGRQEVSPFCRRMDGFGYHEVIIETPDHNRPMPVM